MAKNPCQGKTGRELRACRKRSELQEARAIKKGEIMHTSWGYDQTNNDYCRVLENTGKTIKCQKLSTKDVERISPGYGTVVIPDKKKPVCKPFRIRISPYTYDGEERVVLVGSYPLSNEDRNCDSKHRGNWSKWDGKPDINTER